MIQPAAAPIFLTGATGFVGSHAYPVLEAAGYTVIAGTRDPAAAARRFPGKQFRHFDLRDPPSVRKAVQGCGAAVYLVHSMATDIRYEAAERAAAAVFVEAAEQAGLERIVYLGGMRPSGEPSRHLRSRLATGEILRSGSVPTIELQATMILGSGSESFRMVRDLAARLPIMLLPSWSQTRTEPIGIADVTFALSAALARVPAVHSVYALPGPRVVTAREILRCAARLLGHETPMFHLPLISPKLSSYWIRLITRSDHHVSDELVEGLKTDILAPDAGFWKLFPEHRRQSFEDAVRCALEAEARHLPPRALMLERALDRISGKPSR